jgi:RNA polymerase-binding transcription factor DksA
MTAIAAQRTLTSPHLLPARLGQTLARALEREQIELQHRIAALEQAEYELSEGQGEEGRAGSAAGDVATELAQEELVISLLRGDRAQLARVEAALRRLSERRYGTCARCGTPIPFTRLQALPWTEWCRTCASALDH